MSDDADEIIPGTDDLTRGELRERMAAATLADRQRLASAVVKSRGRSQTPASRARIRAKLKAYRREQALAADFVHPLRAKRLQAHMTQADLAAKAFVCPTVIQRLETKKGAPPSRLTLARLASTLRCTPDALT